MKSNVYKNKSNNTKIVVKKKENGSKSEIKSEKIIVTAALPYANGQIHIGHLLEYIQADIYARFLKLIRKDCLYICASDMHGTPIEVNAAKAGISPEKFVNKFWKEHQKDFASFLIKFDNFWKTHSPENKELSIFFYSELKKKGLIYTKTMNVIYCNSCSRYLPDRYVRGTCPHCTTSDQYGDVCENCGSVLKAIELINPKCSTCSKNPEQRESQHYFFALSKLQDKLEKWINSESSGIQPEVKNWLKSWMKKGLEDWCVSRDEPYFGFEIPDSKKETGQKKYFYVWLDAPVGYVSSTKHYCDKNKLKWEDYWKKGQVYHIIGKDIAYFHFLFWPAMLMEVGFPLPKLTVHGFLTVNGLKMSKSRGTFFTAEDFISLYSAEGLRFFYASHLDRKIVDIDLNLEDFKAVNNNVLMGSLGNFCYRVLTFAEKNYGEVEKVDVKTDAKDIEKVEKLIEEVASNYKKLNFKSAVKVILRIADVGNAYFQNSEVWKDKDSEESKKRVAFCVNLARNLSILVQPILPEFSGKIWKSIGEKELEWSDLSFEWKGKLNKPEMLVKKIEKVESSTGENANKLTFPLNLKVGKIIEVKDHPNADSLYLLKVDFGGDGTKDSKGKDVRQVVAGLKRSLLPKDLLNKKTVFSVNMKPAKLRGEKSEAMILVADDKENFGLLSVKKTSVGDSVNFFGLENSTKEITFDQFLEVVMYVKDNKVIFDGKKLSSNVEDVVVKGVKEGAPIK